MTKKQNSDEGEESKAAKRRRGERARAQALYRWAQKIDAATREYAEDIEHFYGSIDISEIPRGAVEEMSQRVTTWLASAIAAGCFPDGEPYGVGSSLTQQGARVAVVGDRFEMYDPNLQTLCRIHAAIRPKVDNKNAREAVDLAVERIDGWARLYVDALSANGAARDSILADYVQRLSLDLMLHVHPAFGDLLGPKSEQIGPLLARWIPRSRKKAKRRAARKTKAGEPSKLTCAGILVELNRMVTWPLGMLTADGVDQAVRRYRKNAAARLL